MNKEAKLAIFDFCETIVSIQSANTFINYIAENEKTKFSILISWLEPFLTQTRIYALFDKLFPQFNISKRINLFKIKGLTIDKLDKYALCFYNDILLKKMNASIINEINKYKNQQYKIIVISGGYEPYLNIFSKNYNVDVLLATKLAVKDYKLTGFIDGEDCMFDNKVKRLEEFLKENNITISQSTVFTDSITDLPLLKWCNTAFVVSQKKVPNWLVRYNFNAFILNDDK